VTMSEKNFLSIKAIILSIDSMSVIKLNICLILTSLGIALGLFYYGINLPLQFRMRGDAYTYLMIAQHFTSFSEALNYMGDRTLGFPLFDYLFVYLDSNRSSLSQINHICWTLFIMHELISLWICFICVKCRLFKISSIYFGLLFLMLAAYPAIVMHATTPLTDVLGMDLLLIGFSIFAWATHTVNSDRVSFALIFLGLISGFCLGYAILVRPAYWLGIVGFLTVYILMTGVNRLVFHLNGRRSMVMCIVTILTLAAVLLPVIDHCKARYHTLCLQDPRTFNYLEHMKVGLGSARTPWNYASSPSGVVPSYPDAFLVKHFHDRCPVTSVFGSLNSNNSNLLSCMYNAPHLAVVYFIKKVTGLFDTFRMTPYTELVTPTWYLWVARFFSSVAFVGFWILLWEGIKGIYQLAVYRKPVSILKAAVWSFCIIQVSVHSILHVEERFALAWIPFCIIAFFLKIKAIQEKSYSSKLRWMWFIFGALLMLGYFIQVSIWDYGMSHNIIL